ncbi:hypothetical protein A2U01_0096092, partial [Trifolium medium]|nr:hypothetical protein [Trifolium medium]
MVSSFLDSLFISDIKNGEVPGSELEADEVPASVVTVNGVPSSGLLVG